jgi:hypothetical protein
MESGSVFRDIESRWHLRPNKNGTKAVVDFQIIRTEVA